MPLQLKVAMQTARWPLPARDEVAAGTTYHTSRISYKKLMAAMYSTGLHLPGAVHWDAAAKIKAQFTIQWRGN